MGSRVLRLKRTLLVSLRPRFDNYLADLSPPVRFHIYFTVSWFDVVPNFSKSFCKSSPFVLVDEISL